MLRWKPVLLVDDEVVELEWLTKQRHVLTPGTHVLTMALMRGEEREADTTTNLQVGPGEHTSMVAYLTVDGSWQFDILRTRPDFGDAARA